MTSFVAIAKERPIRFRWAVSSANRPDSVTGDPSVTEPTASREALTTASHKLAEALYMANAAAATAPTDGDAAAAGTADEAKKDEGVIDAEYVDAEK